VEAYPDLQDALVELPPHRVALVPPEFFVHLVLLEELASVEQLDPDAQGGVQASRRRTTTSSPGPTLRRSSAMTIEVRMPEPCGPVNRATKPPGPRSTLTR